MTGTVAPGAEPVKAAVARRADAAAAESARARRDGRARVVHDARSFGDAPS
jgi:hypothetical protein